MKRGHLPESHPWATLRHRLPDRCTEAKPGGDEVFTLVAAEGKKKTWKHIVQQLVGEAHAYISKNTPTQVHNGA